MKKLRWSLDVDAVALLVEQKATAIKHLRAAIEYLEAIPDAVIVETLTDAKPGRITGGSLGEPHTAEGEYIDGWKGLWSATVIE